MVKAPLIIFSGYVNHLEYKMYYNNIMINSGSGGGYVSQQSVTARDQNNNGTKQFDHFGRRIQNIDPNNESEYLGIV